MLFELIVSNWRRGWKLTKSGVFLKARLNYAERGKKNWQQYIVYMRCMRTSKFQPSREIRHFIVCVCVFFSPTTKNFTNCVHISLFTIIVCIVLIPKTGKQRHNIQLAGCNAYRVYIKIKQQQQWIEKIYLICISNKVANVSGPE